MFKHYDHEFRQEHPKKKKILLKFYDKKKNKPSLVSGGTAPLTAFLSCFKNRSTSLLS